MVGVGLGIYFGLFYNKKSSSSTSNETPVVGENQDKQTELTFELSEGIVDGVKGYVILGLKDSSKVNIVIPETYKNIRIIKIGENAFENSSIKQITISKNLIEIGNSAFKSCNKLESIIFNSAGSLQTIGNFAFSGCSAMTQFSVPVSLINIGMSAFENCTGLNDLIFVDGSSVKRFYAQNLFNNCNVRKVIIESGVVDANQNVTDAFIAFMSGGEEGAIEIIKSNSFIYQFESLDELRFENGATKIDQLAFCLLKNINLIYVSESVKQIGEYAFFGNISNLEYPYGKIGTVHMQNGVEYIAECAFGFNIINKMYFPSTFNCETYELYTVFIESTINNLIYDETDQDKAKIMLDKLAYAASDAESAKERTNSGIENIYISDNLLEAGSGDTLYNFILGNYTDESYYDELNKENHKYDFKFLPLSSLS